MAVEHCSNTNPLKNVPLDSAAEAERLELQAVLAYRGTRVLKSEFANTVWSIVAATQVGFCSVGGRAEGASTSCLWGLAHSLNLLECLPKSPATMAS